jgi:hypothetical protein
MNVVNEIVMNSEQMRYDNAVEEMNRFTQTLN